MGDLLFIEDSIFTNSFGIFDYQDFQIYSQEYMPLSHGENAGAILTFSQNLFVKNCYFSNNSNLNGGAIYLNKHINSDVQYVRIEMTIFARNGAGESGSALYLGKNIQYIFGLVTDCLFQENYSFQGIFD